MQHIKGFRSSRAECASGLLCGATVRYGRSILYSGIFSAMLEFL